jgi:hypothetical protein
VVKRETKRQLEKTGMLFKEEHKADSRIMIGNNASEKIMKLFFFCGTEV